MTAPAVWILGGIRTPFARAGTALRHLSVVELGRLAVGELLARHELDPARLDEVILGNCAQPADAANVARVTALRAGIPERVPGLTVHRNCASGMEAVGLAAERIQLGRAQLVLAGGMESMSQLPLLFPPEFGVWLEGVTRAKRPLELFHAVGLLDEPRDALPLESPRYFHFVVAAAHHHPNIASYLR